MGTLRVLVLPLGHHLHVYAQHSLAVAPLGQWLPAQQVTTHKNTCATVLRNTQQQLRTGKVVLQQLRTGHNPYRGMQLRHARLGISIPQTTLLVVARFVIFGHRPHF